MGGGDKPSFDDIKDVPASVVVGPIESGAAHDVGVSVFGDVRGGVVCVCHHPVVRPYGSGRARTRVHLAQRTGEFRWFQHGRQRRGGQHSPAQTLQILQSWDTQLPAVLNQRRRRLQGCA